MDRKEQSFAGRLTRSMVPSTISAFGTTPTHDPESAVPYTEPYIDHSDTQVPTSDNAIVLEYRRIWQELSPNRQTPEGSAYYI